MTFVALYICATCGTEEKIAARLSCDDFDDNLPDGWEIGRFELSDGDPVDLAYCSLACCPDDDPDGLVGIRGCGE